VAIAGPTPAGAKVFWLRRGSSADDAAACQKSAEMLAESYVTESDAEGRRAFSGSRAPVWQGRRTVFDKMTLHH
jgi:hypothetical protein